MIAPGGSHATVVAVYLNVGEVLVQWTNGERARFKISKVRLVPSKEE